MFNNIGLDIFIGLIFIFLIYSLLATIIQEIIANKLAFRSKVLEKAILRMLEDGKTTANSRWRDRFDAFKHMLGKPNLLQNKTISPWFYVHPLIQYLGEDNFYSKPAYITSQNFSKVILDLLKGLDNSGTNDIQAILGSLQNGTIHKLPVNINAQSTNPAIRAIVNQQQNEGPNISSTVAINTDTTIFLRSLWSDAGGDIDKFRLKLEQWFDDTMDRATGWYKRYTQYLLFVIGLIIAFTFNADTIATYKILSKDKVAREQLVQMAITNKDKYVDIIKDIKTNSEVNPAKLDTLLSKKDTALNKVYSMVSDDANAANNILGLGRPWKDSCRLWNGYFNILALRCEPGLKEQYLKLEHRAEKIHIDAEQKIKIIHALDLAKKKNDNIRIQRIHAALIMIQKASRDSVFPDSVFQNLAAFKKRYEYIKAETEGHWFRFSPRQAGDFETALGWLLTALAVSLGAPFWFDLLNKVMKLRSAGVKVTSASNVTSTASESPQSNTPAVSINLNNQSSGEAVG